MNKIPFQNLDFYQFQCPDDILEEVLVDVSTKDKDKKINWSTSIPGVSVKASFYSYDENNLPVYYPKLFDWFDECLKVISIEHFNGKSLSIVDSWLTKSTLGRISKGHSHASSIVSGLLYFQTYKRSGTLFTHEGLWAQHFNQIFGGNELYFRQIEVLPERGKLIIWRSDIKHQIQPHSELDTRYTLAFNTFFDNLISAEDTGRLTIHTKSVKQQHIDFNKQ